MKNRSILSVIFLFLICMNLAIASNEVISKTVRIEGEIVDYKGIYKTGQLTYFDAITRVINDELFEINKKGKFAVSFKLTHPIIGSISFDIENDYYSDFYIEPGKEYNVKVFSGSMIFLGETGIFNKEISAYYDSLHVALGTKLEEADLLHQKNLSINEYLHLQKQFETEEAEFLRKYNQIHSLTPTIREVLESEIKFKTACSWVNYRYDYSSGGRIMRDTLPPNFYNDLLNEYKINSFKDCQTRNCIDYISNLVTVFEKKEADADRRIAYYGTFNQFSPNDLELLYQVYKGNSKAINSKEYKLFQSQDNKFKMMELSSRFNVHILLQNVSKLKQDLGRDLIISQCVARNYFMNNLNPTLTEWDEIEKCICDKSIFEYLKLYFIDKSPLIEQVKSETSTIKISTEQVKAKYIDKYLGKVVYIDFYSTWCGPCRGEIPFAKALFAEFKYSDVVFLNLCAQSKKEDWDNLIKQKGIEGENYLLSNEEFNLLSKLYNVNGFPTYILIDRNGKLSNNKAPRPSTKQTIMDEINKLL